MTSSSRRDLRLNGFLPYVLANLAERVSAGLSHIYADEYQLTIPEWRVIANLAEHDTLNAPQYVEFTTMAKRKVSREWKIRVDVSDSHWFDGLVGCAVAASMQGAVLLGEDDRPNARPTIRLSTIQRSRR